MDKPFSFKIGIYTFLLILTLFFLTVGMTFAASWWPKKPPNPREFRQAQISRENPFGCSSHNHHSSAPKFELIKAPDENGLSDIRIDGPRYIGEDEVVTLKAVTPRLLSGSYAWSEDDPHNKIEIVGATDKAEIQLKSKTASDSLNDASLKVTFLPPDGQPLEAVHSVTVVGVEIKPDDRQKGVTGDEVPSTQDNPTTPEKEGKKHYVSPKKRGDFVILRAEVTPKTVDFESALAWEGGEGVADHPNKRRVRRDVPSDNPLKVKLRETNIVSDEMIVWVVFAKISPIRVRKTTLEDGLVDPPEGPTQKGKFVRSQWLFVATIRPLSIISDNPTSVDIPDLTGHSTLAVPGATKIHITSGHLMSKNADRKWDISRQIRIRVHSPRVRTADYDETVAGDIYQGFVSTSKLVVDYPENEVEGNDDIGTEDEDNNPYSNIELQPGTTAKTSLGQLASSDLPIAPVWVKTTGNSGDKLEWRLHFREFVRLQIGEKWFRISDFADGEWKHIAKAKKEADDWIDDGSSAETNNLGFDNPF